MSQRTHCPQKHEYTDSNTYVDPQGYRHCKACRRERMASRRTGGPGRGVNNSAKTHCPRNHEYTPENTKVYRGKRVCGECAKANARRQVLRKYGLTPESFQVLLDRQHGVCAICKDTLVPGPGLHIDHDHACCAGPYSCGSCVRGLLCGACNSLVGMARDNVTVLSDAITYLESR